LFVVTSEIIQTSSKKIDFIQVTLLSHNASIYQIINTNKEKPSTFKRSKIQKITLLNKKFKTLSLWMAIAKIRNVPFILAYISVLRANNTSRHLNTRLFPITKPWKLLEDRRGPLPGTDILWGRLK